MSDLVRRVRDPLTCNYRLFVYACPSCDALCRSCRQRVGLCPGETFLDITKWGQENLEDLDEVIEDCVLDYHLMEYLADHVDEGDK